MPTSKNTGIATRKPTAVRATATRRAPSLAVKWSARDCTPPETSIIRQDRAERDQEGDPAHGASHPGGHHGENVFVAEYLRGHGHQE